MAGEALGPVDSCRFSIANVHNVVHMALVYLSDERSIGTGGFDTLSQIRFLTSHMHSRMRVS